MWSHSSANLQDILQSSRNAEKVTMVMALSTNQVSRGKENPKYLILQLSFYPQDNKSQPPKYIWWSDQDWYTFVVVGLAVPR
jgi:hypothetical protein